MKSTQFLPPYLSVNAFKYKYVALIQMLKHIKCKLDIKTHIWWSGSNLKLTRAENETERNWYKPARNPKQRKRNHQNETTETSETIETTKTKRLKPSHQTEKKKAVDDNKNIAIRFVSIVVYSWSNSRENRSLDCHDVVVCFGRYGGFVFQITVVSFRFGCYGGVVLVVSLVSVVSFRSFSFAVSCFSTCCLARLHFTSELNSHLYWT